MLRRQLSAYSPVSAASLRSAALHGLGRAMDDRLAEPTRMPLLPGFADAKRSARLRAYLDGIKLKRDVQTPARHFAGQRFGRLDHAFVVAARSRRR